MPYAKRRKYPKRKKARTYRRPYRRTRRNGVPNFRSPHVGTPGIMAKTILRKHRYAESFQVQPGTTSTLGTYQFRCNGMYDPNYSGAGHQPFGFDQMCTFYKKYTVIGSKITVKAVLPSGGTVDAFVALAYDSDYTSDYSTDSDTFKRHFIESKNGPWGVITQSDEKLTLSSNWSLKKMKKIHDPVGKIEYYGTQAADPTDADYWTVVVTPLTSGEGTGLVQFLIVIDYITVWHDPVVISQS